MRTLYYYFLFFLFFSLQAMEEELPVSVKPLFEQYCKVVKDARGILQKKYLEAEGWERVWDSCLYVRHQDEEFRPEDEERAVPFRHGKKMGIVLRAKGSKLCKDSFLTAVGRRTPALYVIGPNAKGDIVWNNKIASCKEIISLKVAEGVHVEALALHPNQKKVVAKRNFPNKKVIYLFDYEDGHQMTAFEVQEASFITYATITDDTTVIATYFDAEKQRYKMCFALYPDLEMKECTPEEGWLPSEMLKPFEEKIKDKGTNYFVASYINNMQTHPLHSSLLMLELQPRIMRKYSDTCFVTIESAPYYVYSLFDIISKKLQKLPFKMRCYDSQLVGIAHFLSDLDYSAPYSVQFADHIPTHGEHFIRSLEYCLPEKRRVVRLKNLDINNDCLYSMLLIARAKEWLQQKKPDEQEGKEILEGLEDKKFIENPYKLLWQCTYKRVNKWGKVCRSNPFKEIYVRVYGKKNKSLGAKCVAWRNSKKK